MRRTGALLVGFAGFFVLALGSRPAHAAGDAPPPLSIGPGRLYTTEGREIVFSRFEFVAYSARYQGLGQSTATLVPASSLLRIERESGDLSLRGMATGGFMGVASTLGAAGLFYGLSVVGHLLLFESDESKFNWGLASGLAAGGLVIGAGVGYHYGAGFKTYTRAYDDPSLRRP